EARATTISTAANSNRNPPAIRKAGSEILMASNNLSPTKAKDRSRIVAMTVDFKAVRRLLAIVSLRVKATNIGTTANGSIITNNVTKACHKNCDMYSVLFNSGLEIPSLDETVQERDHDFPEKAHGPLETERVLIGPPPHLHARMASSQMDYLQQ